MESSKKLQNIIADDFSEAQHYFNDKCLENGRLAFKLRVHMVDEIPANFKNKYKKDEDLLCKFCNQMKEFNQSHCVVCPAWEEQRSGLDLNKIDDLVTFFRNMLAEKGKIETMKKKGPPGGMKTARHDSCSSTVQ